MADRHPAVVAVERLAEAARTLLAVTADFDRPSDLYDRPSDLYDTVSALAGVPVTLGRVARRLSSAAHSFVGRPGLELTDDRAADAAPHDTVHNARTHLGVARLEANELATSLDHAAQELSHLGVRDA